MEIKERTWFNVLLVDVCNGVPKFLAEIPKDGVRFKTTPNLDCVVLFRVEEREVRMFKIGLHGLRNINLI